MVSDRRGKGVPQRSRIGGLLLFGGRRSGAAFGVRPHDRFQLWFIFLSLLGNHHRIGVVSGATASHEDQAAEGEGTSNEQETTHEPDSSRWASEDQSPRPEST